MQMSGSPRLTAFYESADGSDGRVIWQQRWFMLGTDIGLDRSLPRTSSSLNDLYDCCRRIEQFYQAVMPSFGKFPGSMGLEWRGEWNRKGKANPLEVEFVSKSIMDCGIPTYGLPKSKKTTMAVPWQP